MDCQRERAPFFSSPGVHAWDGEPTNPDLSPIHRASPTVQTAGELS
jgi:hypothetical protein